MKSLHEPDPSFPSRNSAVRGFSDGNADFARSVALSSSSCNGDKPQGMGHADVYQQRALNGVFAFSTRGAFDVGREPPERHT